MSRFVFIKSGAHLPLIAFIFQAAVLCVLLVGGANGSSSSASPIVLAAGEEGYGIHCALCHYDGTEQNMTPSLFESPSVKGAPERLIKIVLHGQSGVAVSGGRVLGGIMPPQDYLTDEEIAETLTYVRHHFGNSASPIMPEQVAALREAPGL